MQLTGKSILVLGGSGVLGAQLSTDLIAQGAAVLATARTVDSAANIAPGVSTRLLLDFENPDSISVLAKYLIETEAPIDAVINATGVVAFGSLSELSSAALERLFAINTLGPIKIIQGLLPALVKAAERGAEPFVVNITGVVAETPMAGMAAYSASKAALFAFDQAAGRELKKLGIRIIDARPGHTETGLAGRAIEGSPPAFAPGMSPAQVSARIIRAILNGETSLPASEFTS